MRRLLNHIRVQGIPFGPRQLVRSVLPDQASEEGGISGRGLCRARELVEGEGEGDGG